MKQVFREQPIGLFCFLPFNNLFFDRSNKNYQEIPLFLPYSTILTIPINQEYPVDVMVLSIPKNQINKFFLQSDKVYAIYKRLISRQSKRSQGVPCLFIRTGNSIFVMSMSKKYGA